MSKIEISCSCGQVFTMKENEIKRCPRCGKFHRGPVSPKEFQITMN
jgi:predicted RNA-binding Zn-ribbon protein involved in translation (DUF1610 family)